MTGEPRGFDTVGKVAMRSDGITINELPLGRWTSSYKSFLLKAMSEGKAFWKDFAEFHTERTVHFALSVPAEQV